MAFAYSNLGVRAATGSLAATFTTGSVSPSANSVVFVVMSANAAGVAITFTLTDTFGDSGGGSWVSVGLTNNANYWFGDVFYRFIGTGPASGTIKLTGSASTFDPSLVIDQITGEATTTPVAQSTENDASYSATGTVTLGSGPAASSLVYTAAVTPVTAVSPAVTTAGYTPGTTMKTGTTETAASAYKSASAAAAVAWGSLGGTNACTLYAVEVNVAAGTNSGPNYAGAAADMGGGSGSWSNLTNADGAPDGATADWTAP